MSYGRGDYSGDSREYGGGGSSGDNYYDRRADFSDESRPSHGGGRQESGYGGGYGEGHPSHGGGRQEGGYSGGGGGSGGDDDYSGALHHAQRNRPEGGSGSSGGESSFFGEAVNFLKQNKSRFSNEDIDESHMVSSHQSLYGGGSEGRTHDSNSVGAGAAVEALKLFTSGSSSGGDKNQLIGTAMSQAAKLWEQQSSSGNVTGDKQSAINKAAEMALKMYMKGQGNGLGGTGGPSGLLGIASKFL